MSYDDAVAYADWMAFKTRKAYRLASEGEWEYAARAGTATAWYWGDAPEPGCADAYSLPVASFAANAYGLYDMIGNAFEWVVDCSSANHDGAPVDGSARLSPGCQQHFLKGGAFHTPIWLTRAAVRGNPLKGDVHMSTIGFRIARSLDLNGA